MLESVKMAEAIRQGMTDNPVQWSAFLTGLEAGYRLGKKAQEPQEPKA